MGIYEGIFEAFKFFFSTLPFAVTFGIIMTLLSWKVLEFVVRWSESYQE